MSDRPLQLYVDSISPDGAIAMVENRRSIYWNLHSLGLLRENVNNSYMFSTGKFICIIMAIEDNKAGMMFFDLKANPNAKNLFLDSPDTNDKQRLQFTSLAEVLNANYSTKKDQTILLVGEPSKEWID